MSLAIDSIDLPSVDARTFDHPSGTIDVSGYGNGYIEIDAKTGKPKRLVLHFHDVVVLTEDMIERLDDVKDASGHFQTPRAFFKGILSASIQVDETNSKLIGIEKFMFTDGSFDLEAASGVDSGIKSISIPLVHQFLI